MNNEDEYKAVEKKEYDGSKRPRVIVQNLKSLTSVQNALERVTKRLGWVKNRVSEIQPQWNDPSTPTATLSGIKAEYDGYVVEVAKLKEKATQLTTLLEEVDANERKALDDVTLEEIEF